MGNSLKKLEQGRASFAFECAESFYKSEDKKDKEYKQYIKKIPMMIKTNGLGATFAFMLSKNNKKEGKYYSQIGEEVTRWLRENRSFLFEQKISKVPDFEGLIKHIISVDSTTYRAITIEVLSFLNWLRRFAEGLYDGE